jgi:hypothetical protein
MRIGPARTIGPTLFARITLQLLLVVAASTALVLLL